MHHFIPAVLLSFQRNISDESYTNSNSSHFKISLKYSGYTGNAHKLCYLNGTLYFLFYFLIQHEILDSLCTT